MYSLFASQLSLEQAIDDFRTRIVFAEVEKLREQNFHALCKVRAFEAVCEESKKQDKQLLSLTSQIQQLKMTNNSEVAKKDKVTADYWEMKRKYEDEQKDNEVLQEKNQKLQGWLETRMNDVSQLSRYSSVILINRRCKAKLQKAKYKALKEENAKLREQKLSEESQPVPLDELMALDDHFDEVRKLFVFVLIR